MISINKQVCITLLCLLVSFVCKTQSICPTVTVNDTTLCVGDSVLVYATMSQTGTFNYIWTVPAGVVDPGDTSQFYTSVAGEYSVTIPVQTSYLCNADFEDIVAAPPLGSWGNILTGNIDCWDATTGVIEVWRDGHLGVPAYSGTTYIELNASSAGDTYQEFEAVPGASLAISFAHRGRSGVDVVDVSVGPPGGPFVSLGQFSDDNLVWGYHTVTYILPNNGQTTYQLKFTAVSSSGGDASFGNFLDAITVDLEGCPAIIDTGYVSVASPDTVELSCGISTSSSVQFVWGASNGTSDFDVSYQINGGVSIDDNAIGNVLEYSINGLSLGDAVTLILTPVGGCFESDTLTCSPQSCSANSGTITK